jgi:hypothetical protein
MSRHADLGEGALSGGDRATMDTRDPFSFSFFVSTVQRNLAFGMSAAARKG